MRLVLSLACALILSGCLNFRDVGKDLGGGLGSGIKPDADTIGSNLGGGLVRSARDTLTSDATRERLASLLDTLGTALARRAAESRDTLRGNSTRAWIAGLKEELLGRTTAEQIGLLREELLGQKTSAFLKDSLRLAIGGLRGELLGPSTRDAIDSVISAAIATLSSEYRDKMQPLVHAEESFLQRNVSTILWTAGGVLAAVLVVAGVLFVRGKKDRSVLDLLTYQIHEMPDQQAYDELIRRIRRKAQETGVEPRLQKILDEHGLRGEENWVPPARAL